MEFEHPAARIFYDHRGCRLVYIDDRATSAFWDQHWLAKRSEVEYRQLPRKTFVARYTEKYLPPPATVLEGGCGLGHNSWVLHRLGYRTIALDFAEQTVAYLRERIPEINPVQGDVRNLQLGRGSIDAYWSLGVIEHFYEGYTAIRDEMARVIRPGGYLFLTFPHMSRLRRARAMMGGYPTWREEPEQLADFYQFALDERRVARDFEHVGFRTLEIVRSLGLTGLSRDVPGVEHWIAATRRTGRLGKGLLKVLERGVRPVSSHTALVVLKRT